jgi:hypothetical protein
MRRNPRRSSRPMWLAVYAACVPNARKCDAMVFAMCDRQMKSFLKMQDMAPNSSSKYRPAVGCFVPLYPFPLRLSCRNEILCHCSNAMLFVLLFLEHGVLQPLGSFGAVGINVGSP